MLMGENQLDDGSDNMSNDDKQLAELGREIQMKIDAVEISDLKGQQPKHRR